MCTTNKELQRLFKEAISQNLLEFYREDHQPVKFYYLKYFLSEQTIKDTVIKIPQDQ